MQSLYFHDNMFPSRKLLLYLDRSLNSMKYAILICIFRYPYLVLFLLFSSMLMTSIVTRTLFNTFNRNMFVVFINITLAHISVEVIVCGCSNSKPAWTIGSFCSCRKWVGIVPILGVTNFRRHFYMTVILC